MLAYASQRLETLPPGFVENVPYRQATLQGKTVELVVDVFRPETADRATPVLVWFHSGAFCTGTIKRPGHRALARHANKAGIAVAVPQYRLMAEDSDLGATVQAKLPELLALCDPDFRLEMAGAWALAALEDSAALLRWLIFQSDILGLSGEIVVGGSSAGGVNALNLVQLVPHLALEVPKISGAICYSGGFAYPDLYLPGRVPVLAAHDVADQSVDIASIRALSKRDPYLDLIENTDQGHGGFRLVRNEGNGKAYGRIVAFVTRVLEMEKEMGA